MAITAAAESPTVFGPVAFGGVKSSDLCLASKNASTTPAASIRSVARRRKKGHRMRAARSICASNFLRRRSRSASPIAKPVARMMVVGVARSSCCTPRRVPLLCCRGNAGPCLGGCRSGESNADAITPNDRRIVAPRTRKPMLEASSTAQRTRVVSRKALPEPPKGFARFAPSALQPRHGVIPTCLFLCDVQWTSSRKAWRQPSSSRTFSLSWIIEVARRLLRGSCPPPPPPPLPPLPRQARHASNLRLRVRRDRSHTPAA